MENCSIAALFEEYGVEIPTTIEELEAACDVFLENGIVPMVLPNRTKYFGSMYYMYLVDRMAGPSLFAEAANGGERTFEDDVFTWADQKIQEWAEKGYFGDGYNSLDGETGMHRQMLYNNEAAMAPIGLSMTPEEYNKAMLDAVTK